MITVKYAGFDETNTGTYTIELTVKRDELVACDRMWNILTTLNSLGGSFSDGISQNGVYHNADKALQYALEETLGSTRLARIVRNLCSDRYESPSLVLDDAISEAITEGDGRYL